MIYEILKFFKRTLVKPFFYLLNLRIIDKRKFDLYKNNYERLKNFIDVRNLKKAIGLQREIQLKNYKFTKEIINELERNNIKPFMIFGTLLGAERHNGYIPWDDDIDFGLMRKDYEKLLDFAGKNFQLCIQDINLYFPIKTAKKTISKLLTKYPNKILAIRYHHLLKFIKGTSIDDYVQMDIFPLDYYKDSFTFDEYKNLYKYMLSKIMNINNIPKIIEFIKNEREQNPNIVEDSEKVCFGIDNIGFYTPFMNKVGMWAKNDIFPLKKMNFEDTTFYAPNNHIKILEYIYGDWEGLPSKIEAPHAAERS